jgi:hypothetical protein
MYQRVARGRYLMSFLQDFQRRDRILLQLSFGKVLGVMGIHQGITLLAGVVYVARPSCSSLVLPVGTCPAVSLPSLVSAPRAHLFRYALLFLPSPVSATGYRIRVLSGFVWVFMRSPLTLVGGVMYPADPMPP